jgi:hypothetical protein
MRNKKDTEVKFGKSYPLVGDAGKNAYAENTHWQKSQNHFS